MSRGGTNAAWRAARARAYAVYGNACLKCGNLATDIDHIVEVANGGTDDIENLQPLCNACHKAKTAEFNSKRKKPTMTPFFWSDATPRLPSLSYLSLKPTIEPPIAQKKEKKTNG
jgi:5-methylcytosine-specific restriction endonuclease McrA